MISLIGGGAAGAFIRGRGEKPHPAALVEKVKVDIQLTPSPPRANERAEFTATVKPGAAARYEWRFGDGEKSSAVAPKHVYRHPGTYTAKLIVRGPHREFVGEGLLAVHVGPESSRRRSPPRRPPRSRSSAYVPLEPSPPIASFRFTPSSPVIGQVVVFDAASSSEPDRRASITSYAWKFGDGTTGTGRMPSHRYEKPGTYTAELVIADTREASASATREVVVKSTTPSAPSDVVASAGDSSAEVRWAAPEDGGSAISAYVVRPYAEGKQEPAVEVPTGTHAAIGGLTNGTTYTFTVTAVSSVGRGPASKHSNAVTPTAQVPTVKINPPAITKPAAPTSVAAIPGEDSATVTWTAPPNGGSVITSYTITPYVGDEARPAENVSGAITGAEVAGLTSGISYTFTVSATNAGGQGPPSAHSNAVTPTSPPLPPRPTVPSAPTGVSASAGEASATVTWAAPASGNSAITSYTVTPYAGEEAKAPIDVTSGTSTTVRGLVNGTTYTFTVSAVNLVGTGPPSERSPAVTPVGVPAAPTGVVATSGREGVALSWVVPADEGSPITSYTITIIPYAEGEPQTPTSERSVSGAGGEATIPPTELTPEQRYAFTVAAVNAVGKGPASMLSNVVTAEGSEP